MWSVFRDILAILGGLFLVLIGVGLATTRDWSALPSSDTRAEALPVQEWEVTQNGKLYVVKAEAMTKDVSGCLFFMGGRGMFGTSAVGDQVFVGGVIAAKRTK